MQINYYYYYYYCCYIDVVEELVLISQEDALETHRTVRHFEHKNDNISL